MLQQPNLQGKTFAAVEVVGAEELGSAAECQAAVHLLDVNTVRATFYEERENRPVAPNALELQRTSKKSRVVAEVVRKEPILAVSVQVSAW